MSTKFVREKASIVLVGNFNPSIFHPAWFKEQGLISEEPDNSDYENFLVANNISQIKLPDEIVFRAYLGKVVVETSLKSSIDQLIDLVSGTFSILPHSPVSAIGINLDYVYEDIPYDTWVNAGTELAPKAPWHSVYDYVKDLNEEEQKRLGLWTQTMIIPRNDDLQGSIFHKISILDIEKRSLEVAVNNHIVTNPDENNAKQAISIISESASNIIEETRTNIEKFMERFGAL